jgi:DNA-directed RNA polymerase beta' subunit
VRPRIEVMTDSEVRANSFGRVHNPVFPGPETWQEQKGSLFDQRIFGAEVDYRCACGKYAGREFDTWICDMCGVKIGEAAVLRKRRFGHIDLGRQIPHPWFEDSVIGMIPVLPIAYRGDRSGMELDILYSRVVRGAELPEPAQASSTGTATDPLWWAVRQLFENEATAEPVLHRGRPARSLCHFAFKKAGTEHEEVGAYLAALMLKVVV